MSADPSRQAKTPASVDDLLRAWGLRRAPFAADEKSRGIFASASHSEALTFMDTTAALRGVMLLTGPPGSGKSTVLKSWMTTLEPKRFLPLLITQASLSVTGVLEIILAKLGERPRFKRSTNLLVLEKHLAELDPVTLDLLAQSAWFIAARAHASSIEPDHVHQAIKLIPSAHDKIIHP